MSVSNIQPAADGTFIKKGRQWYYEYSDGTLATDCLLDIDGKICYFSPDGRRLYGWQHIGKSDYYFGKKSEGYMYRKYWLDQGDDHYYLKKNGKKATGLHTVSKKSYYFGDDGKRRCGWQVIDGKRYYFGLADEGWMYKDSLTTIDGRLFYLKSDGTMATKWTIVSGEKYYFTKKGAYTGRHVIKKVTYSFGDDGRLLQSGADITVSSDCALLIDSSSGEVLYAKNEYKHHANASTTKIMTAILALENCSLTDKVTASAYAASQEPSKLYLHTGEVFYMEQLLHSLLIPSHNDTAVVIAEHIGGTTDRFAVMMNEKAKALGCTDTHFVTPNGLDQNLNHYTTAQDLAKIMQYAMKNVTFRSIVQKKSYSFTSLSGYRYSFTTTNQFLGSLAGVIGGKSGFTNKAGYCFVGAVKGSNGHLYISVTLGGPTSEQRWEDSRKLLQYAYNFQNAAPSNPDIPAA